MLSSHILNVCNCKSCDEFYSATNNVCFQAYDFLSIVDKTLTKVAKTSVSVLELKKTHYDSGENA